MTRRAVWKYALEILPKQMIAMPEHSQIVHIGIQHGRPMMWVDVPIATSENDVREVQRSFRIVGTGHEEIEPPDVHLGTFLVDGDDYVFHVYEIAP